jgi:hypothetical protein
MDPLRRILKPLSIPEDTIIMLLRMHLRLQNPSQLALVHKNDHGFRIHRFLPSSQREPSLRRIGAQYLHAGLRLPYHPTSDMAMHRHQWMWTLMRGEEDG